MDHSASHAHHTDDFDWTAMAAQLELEGEVLLPYVIETVRTAAEVCRRDGIDVRRILDVGSGPGVAACELARQFASATVVAADGSQELLERARARAEAAGLGGRVATRKVDLPHGLKSLGRADLIWMAMVLHHMDGEAAVLSGLRTMLEPGGVFVLVEHGEPMRFLADGSGPGRPGLTGRLTTAEAEWMAGMHADHSHLARPTGYPAMLEAAGFQVLVDRVVHVRPVRPLPVEARRVVLGRLQRMRTLFEERLDEQDRDALDVLIDEGHPLGVMQRPDVFLDASRHVYIARAGGS